MKKTKRKSKTPSWMLNDYNVTITFEVGTYNNKSMREKVYLVRAKKREGAIAKAVAAFRQDYTADIHRIDIENSTITIVQ